MFGLSLQELLNIASVVETPIVAIVLLLLSAFRKETFPQEGVLPFENRQAYGGFARSLAMTWKEALLHPRSFFTAVGHGEDVDVAVRFAIFTLFVGSVVGMLLSAPFRAIFGGLDYTSNLFWGAVGCWLIVPLGVYFGGTIIHQFLRLWRGAHKEVKTTWRVVAYSGATYILYAVPVLGILIASIWQTVLIIIGLAAAHETQTWRVAMASLTFSLVCLVPLSALMVLWHVLPKM